MASKFYAINRVTNEKWKPEDNNKQYLVMYDSGKLAIITEDFYIYIKPLDFKIYKPIFKGN